MTKFLVADPIFIMSNADWSYTNELSDQRCDESSLDFYK